MEIKAKLSKWGLIKLKIICTRKETINEAERQPTECEKIFANDMTNKELKVQKYINSSSNLRLKNKQPIKKWAEDLNRHFFKDIHMANRHIKRSSTSLIISSVQLFSCVQLFATP